MLRTRLEKRDHMRTLPPSDADLLQASRCPISALHLLHNNSGLGAGAITVIYFSLPTAPLPRRREL
jgi:hypothetical protein